MRLPKTLLSAVRAFTLGSAYVNHAEGLAGSLTPGKSADFVILTGLWDGWMEPNSSMDYGSDAPNQVLRDHFCVVGDYTDENGNVVVFVIRGND